MTLRNRTAELDRAGIRCLSIGSGNAELMDGTIIPSSAAEARMRPGHQYLVRCETCGTWTDHPCETAEDRRVSTICDWGRHALQQENTGVSYEH